MTSPREIHIKSTGMNVLDTAFLFSKGCKHFISEYYVPRTRKRAAIHLRWSAGGILEMEYSNLDIVVSEAPERWRTWEIIFTAQFLCAKHCAKLFPCIVSHDQTMLWGSCCYDLCSTDRKTEVKKTFHAPELVRDVADLSTPGISVLIASHWTSSWGLDSAKFGF